MKPAVLKVLTFICISVSLVSCTKSGTDLVTTPESKTILLTQNAWKIQSVALDNDKNGVADTDVTTSVPACKLDNTYTFQSDSTGTMNEAVAKCVDGDPQTKPFTWSLKSGESILSGTFGFSNGDATIVSMNKTSLVVTYDDNMGTATTYHFMVTLVH